jgi:hypothetical protein
MQWIPSGSSKSSFLINHINTTNATYGRAHSFPKTSINKKIFLPEVHLALFHLP